MNWLDRICGFANYKLDSKGRSCVDIHSLYGYNINILTPYDRVVTSYCKKQKECKCYIVDETDFNTGDGEAVQQCKSFIIRLV